MSADAAIRYVPLAAEHLDDAVEVERLSFATPWGREAIEIELERPQISHYVAAVLPSGRMIGFAGMWVIADEGHIGTIGVHPDFRRQGIGQGMLRWLVHRAVELGVVQLTLEVRKSNTAAQCLYAKHGFLAAGIRKGYYQDTGEDALVMLCSDISHIVRQLNSEADVRGGDGAGQ